MPVLLAPLSRPAFINLPVYLWSLNAIRNLFNIHGISLEVRVCTNHGCIWGSEEQEEEELRLHP